MIGSLRFNLDDPDDKKAFEVATKALDAHLALWEIGQEIFRPARKNGFSDLKLDALLQRHPEVGEAIGLLEEMYFDILKDRNIDLDGL